MTTSVSYHWGTVASTAQLPNVSGAAIQSDAVRAGDSAFIGTTLYVCTTPTAGAGAWSAAGGAASSNVVFAWNGTDISQFNGTNPAISVGYTATTHTLSVVTVSGIPHLRMTLDINAPGVVVGFGIWLVTAAIPRRGIVRCRWFAPVVSAGGFDSGYELHTNGDTTAALHYGLSYMAISLNANQINVRKIEAGVMNASASATRTLSDMETLRPARLVTHEYYYENPVATQPRGFENINGVSRTTGVSGVGVGDNDLGTFTGWNTLDLDSIGLCFRATTNGANTGTIDFVEFEVLKHPLDVA